VKLPLPSFLLLRSNNQRTNGPDLPALLALWSQIFASCHCAAIPYIDSVVLYRHLPHAKPNTNSSKEEKCSSLVGMWLDGVPVCNAFMNIMEPTNIKNANLQAAMPRKPAVQKVPQVAPWPRTGNGMDHPTLCVCKNTKFPNHNFPIDPNPKDVPIWTGMNPFGLAVRMKRGKF